MNALNITLQQQTNNTEISLILPYQLKAQLPLSSALKQQVAQHRGVLGILPPYIAKTSEAPVCRGL